MTSTTQVVTYIFIDLETTGLPKLEQNRTKITEISLVAVKREHLLQCRAGETPRVKHKLTLCLNPGKMISPEATDKTKLSNELLESEPTLNNVFNVICDFVKILEKPACLLAHNGFQFDFPILKASLEHIEKQLPGHLLCADTIIAYNDILNDIEEAKLTKIHNVEKCEIKEIDNNKMNKKELNVEKIIDEPEIVNFRQLNETTPKRGTTVFASTPSKRKSPCNIVANSKRRLTYEETRGKTLENIYEYLLKKTAVGCHEAEKDCVLNLEIAAVLGEQFVLWVDENHCAFSDIQPMIIGVALK